PYRTGREGPLNGYELQAEVVGGGATQSYRVCMSAKSAENSTISTAVRTTSLSAYRRLMLALLNKVVTFGMEIGERHAQFGQGPLDPFHHGVGAADEIVSAVAVGREMARELLFGNPAALALPILRRLAYHVHNFQIIETPFQLLQLVAEDYVFPGFAAVN